MNKLNLVVLIIQVPNIGNIKFDRDNERIDESSTVMGSQFF